MQYKSLTNTLLFCTLLSSAYPLCAQNVSPAFTIEGEDWFLKHEQITPTSKTNIYVSPTLTKNKRFLEVTRTKEDNRPEDWKIAFPKYEETIVSEVDGIFKIRSVEARKKDTANSKLPDYVLSELQFASDRKDNTLYFRVYSNPTCQGCVKKTNLWLSHFETSMISKDEQYLVLDYGNELYDAYSSPNIVKIKIPIPEGFLAVPSEDKTDEDISSYLLMILKQYTVSVSAAALPPLYFAGKYLLNLLGLHECPKYGGACHCLNSN